MTESTDKLTKRQVEALFARYHGERLNQKFSGFNHAGKPWFVHVSSMGGAVWRMAEDLRDRGFLTRYEKGVETSDQLTAKALDALLERLDKLPAPIDRQEILERLEARREVEASRQQVREQQRAEDRRLIAEDSARRRAQRLVELRRLFGEHGLADNWSDEQLLIFGEKVADIAVAN